MATNPSTLPENSGRISAPDANYPYGSAKDDSSGTTGDGTPIKKAILNDTYGFYQWLLTQAGIVPSGNAETVLASDLGDALNALFIKNVKTSVITASNPAWTPSANTKTIEFIVVGGGGGGGGIEGQGSTTAASGGGGGSGGASIIMTSSIASSYAIVVGAGGSGGAAGANNGSAGGASTVVGTGVNISAGGGGGGDGMTGTAGQTVTSGGIGGTSGGGNQNYRGSDGGLGRVSDGQLTQVSYGAPSIFGGMVADNLATGKNAISSGAGGQGALSEDSSANSAGGDGSDGRVIIKEFS